MRKKDPGINKKFSQDEKIFTHKSTQIITNFNAQTAVSPKGLEAAHPAFKQPCWTPIRPLGRMGPRQMSAPDQRGMLPCFFGGMDSRLVSSRLRARSSFLRVSRGMMTSST